MSKKNNETTITEKQNAEKPRSEMTAKELHSLTNEQIDIKPAPIKAEAIEDENIVRIDFEDRKLSFLNLVSAGNSLSDAHEKLKVKFNKAELKKLRGE